MKDVMLIVKNESDQFHIDGVMTNGQRDRLSDVCLGDEPVAVEFTVKSLQVKFLCPNGSIVVMYT